jgi:hypothetical protein
MSIPAPMTALSLRACRILPRGRIEGVRGCSLELIFLTLKRTDGSHPGDATAPGYSLMTAGSWSIRLYRCQCDRGKCRADELLRRELRTPTKEGHGHIVLPTLIFDLVIPWQHI